MPVVLLVDKDAACPDVGGFLIEVGACVGLCFQVPVSYERCMLSRVVALCTVSTRQPILNIGGFFVEPLSGGVQNEGKACLLRTSCSSRMLSDAVLIGDAG